MTDTTVQQAVTVAHDITRNPASIWLSPICDDTAHHGEGRTWAAPAPDETCEDCSEPWVEYVRSDLASVSSASADLPDDVRTLVIAAREFWDDENSGTVRSHALDKALEAFSSRVPYDDEPTPEPVPATNQAGEDNKLRGVLNRITVACNRLRRSEITPQEFDVYALGLLSALATQPATSQEGEADAQDRRLAGMVALFRQSPDIHNPEQAAADIFERLFRNEEREYLQEAAVEAGARAMCDRVNYVGDYDENIDKRRSGWLPQARACIAAFLAATPTPPTLSEDLRAALKPFADIADFYDSCEQHPNGCPDSETTGEMVDLKVGDFRRARAALALARAQVKA